MNTEERRFPVLRDFRKKGPSPFGDFVPWNTMEIVRDEAKRYHSQTLERLAERGGLSWAEIGNLFVNHHSGTRGHQRARVRPDA